MKKYFLPVFLIILAVFLFVHLIHIALATHITVKFAELRPFSLNVPVYYKGIKVGKVLARNHTKDFEHAILTILIYPRALKLPVATVAYLKQHKVFNYFKQDYIELIFPHEKTASYLGNNSIIEGRATIDIREYGANQSLDEIDEIKDNLAKSAENLNYALGGLSDLFSMMNDMLYENRANFKNTTSNFANASANFSNVTKKFDNSINQNKLNSTFDNIASATQNIDGGTSAFNSNSAAIEATINNLQETTCDTRAITKGVRKTLSKPCGGFRLFFGRAIQENTRP